MRKRKQRAAAAEYDRGASRLSAAISRRPREFVGAVMATLAVGTIFTNVLFLQTGPHPAPIFSAKPVVKTAAPAVASRPYVLPPAQPAAAPEAPVMSRTQLIGTIQRELARRGYYDGAADGVWGARTDAAVRDFVQATGVKVNPEANDALLRAIVASSVKPAGNRAAEPVRNDPIAELIAPSKRVLAIQRALTDFGYGQIKPTGNYDPETKAAIEKFQRDHRLPVTGQITDQFVRELAGMTGRPLE